MQDFLHKRFSKSDSVVFRKIANQRVLVPLRRQASDTPSIYTLNEVGARIWELTGPDRTMEEVRDSIVEEFDVDPKRAGEELEIFLEQLLHIGAVHED